MNMYITFVWLLSYNYNINDMVTNKNSYHTNSFRLYRISEMPMLEMYSTMY